MAENSLPPTYTTPEPLPLNGTNNSQSPLLPLRSINPNRQKENDEIITKIINLTEKLYSEQHPKPIVNRNETIEQRIEEGIELMKLITDIDTKLSTMDTTVKMFLFAHLQHVHM